MTRSTGWSKAVVGGEEVWAEEEEVSHHLGPGHSCGEVSSGKTIEVVSW